VSPQKVKVSSETDKFGGIIDKVGFFVFWGWGSAKCRLFAAFIHTSDSHFSTSETYFKD
jgi:hypothetical protein